MQFPNFSFITFPQILFDGFQAEPANDSVANQSLPNFEFGNLFTADVSRRFLFYLLRILRIAPQFVPDWHTTKKNRKTKKLKKLKIKKIYFSFVYRLRSFNC